MFDIILKKDFNQEYTHVYICNGNVSIKEGNSDTKLRKDIPKCIPMTIDLAAIRFLNLDTLKNIKSIEMLSNNKIIMKHRIEHNF